MVKQLPPYLLCFLLLAAILTGKTLSASVSAVGEHKQTHFEISLVGSNEEEEIESDDLGNVLVLIDSSSVNLFQVQKKTCIDHSETAPILIAFQAPDSSRAPPIIAF